MEDHATIEMYNIEKERGGDKTPPYEKEAVEFAVMYPLNYEEAYLIWRVFGEYVSRTVLQNALRRAFYTGILPTDDVEDFVCRLREFVWKETAELSEDRK